MPPTQQPCQSCADRAVLIKGFCPKCYLKQYRATRKTRDPGYKPWATKNKTRVAINLSADMSAYLKHVSIRGKSKLIECLLHAVMPGTVVVVNSHGIIKAAVGRQLVPGHTPLHELVGRSVREHYRRAPLLLAAADATLKGQHTQGVFDIHGHLYMVELHPLLATDRIHYGIVAFAFLIEDQPIPNGHSATSLRASYVAGTKH